MKNPFEVIEARLCSIENLILDLKHKPIQVEPTDKLLTIDEASEFLSLAKQTLYGLTSKGEIPHIKRSKRLYFTKVDLLEYLREGRVKSNSEIKADVLKNLNREV